MTCLLDTSFNVIKYFQEEEEEENHCTIDPCCCRLDVLSYLDVEQQRPRFHRNDIANVSVFLL